MATLKLANLIGCPRMVAFAVVFEPLYAYRWINCSETVVTCKSKKSTKCLQPSFRRTWEFGLLIP